MPTWQIDETQETLRMIQSEPLDIRAVPIGASLRDCGATDLTTTCTRIHDKICRVGARLVDTVAQVQADFAVPIVNKRVSVTPIAMVAESSGASDYTPVAQALDSAAAT